MPAPIKRYTIALDQHIDTSDQVAFAAMLGLV
jgi:hypothetical protein